MAKIKPRVKVPKTVKRGEIFEIKSLISHKMETGQRKDKKTGDKIPRKIINSFRCTYNGETVFSADWHPAISANPYMAFHTVATESGTLEFLWVDDDGTEYTKTAKLKVTG
jgi:sulfur-oxidizing protein SoxZ